MNIEYVKEHGTDIADIYESENSPQCAECQ